MINQAQTEIGVDSTQQVDSLMNTLNQFKTHNLSDQDRASLLDRVDDKFVIKHADLSELFTSMLPDYTLLNQGDIYRFQYETNYFDTENFKLFHMHHAGKSNRLKLRIRNYIDSKKSFFEIKKKNNKGLTTKLRKQRAFLFSSSKFDDAFLKNAFIELTYPLKSKLIVRYQRITFMHKHANQRITIDTQLHFFDPNAKQSCEIKDGAIIEIKRQRGDHSLKHSSVHQYLKQKGYRTNTFSKYCMGCLLCQIPNIKHNNFKANLIAIKKSFTLAFMGDPI